MMSSQQRSHAENSRRSISRRPGVVVAVVVHLCKGRNDSTDGLPISRRGIGKGIRGENEEEKED